MSESVSMALRPLAYATTYDGLHDAMRARAKELQIARLEIDEVGGLQSGYASKLLSPTQIKRCGSMSLGALLGALGLGLVIVVDPEATARVLKRLPQKRNTRNGLTRVYARPRSVR